MGHYYKDGKALAGMMEDVDTRLTPEQKYRARRIIAGRAVGATLAEQVADAELLMMALGVHPTQDGNDDFILPSPGRIV